MPSKRSLIISSVSARARAVLAGEVVGPYLAAEIDIRLGFGIAFVDAVQQGVDFFLGQTIVNGHGYCMMKAVKNTSSAPCL